MSEEREYVYQILELGKTRKNLHHKKGFGGLLFIDLSMIKFSKLSSYIKQLDKENQELKKQVKKRTKMYQNAYDYSQKMELWIRSQDKRILQKVDNIFLDANYEDKRIVTYDGDNVELELYKTKERAFEVLNEIQDLWQNVYIGSGNRFVYQMPKN